ncbi:MAG: AraC family transcriptional regulator [Tannerellaceae bacterium]|jgi:AraC-like DNA-binding protein|nr:AraC family transcriptional regulator [Tannerellaceae bacterium]
MRVQPTAGRVIETRIDIPSPSLADSDMPEIEAFEVENIYAAASFRTVRTPAYVIVDRRICCRENVLLYSPAQGSGCLWFCATLEGDVGSSASGSEDRRWRKGEAGLMAGGGSEECFSFRKGQPFRTIGIMLSPGYMERVASSYPGLSERIHGLRPGCPVSFCPAMERALNDLLSCGSLGDAALLYLDAKIFEILSLFLCRLERKDCPCSPADKERERLSQARRIIEQRYKDPPSLRWLATKVGTNECTLKRRFKELFGTTVYGYLFDYRMEMACRYLAGTDKTIQEIAFLVGYEYPSHFSTAFRRKHRLSPAKYRQTQAAVCY